MIELKQTYRMSVKWRKQSHGTVYAKVNSRNLKDSSS